MSLAPGASLGPYEILERLGAGAMGEVWKARDTRLGRIVAIKRLGSQHRNRFEHEARAIAALNHPSICQIFDVGPDYLVMQYIEGTTLSGPVPSDIAVKLGIEIAAAMEEAHTKGILHRDLKPANILITHSGSAKVLDFGLAKLMNESSSDDATQTVAGTVLGTPAYMAPEQAQGKALDARSDIFSFGAVFYEMLSGRRAFHGESALDALTAVLRDEPAPLPVSSELQQILRKCLAKQPDDRFASMADLRRALARLADSSSGISRSESEPDGAGQGFWLAVAPFKVSGSSPELPALAEGLAEEIVTGLSRFSYLRVLPMESGSRARYLIEASLRQSGSQLRFAVQLSDTVTGARMWAETYNRTWSPDAIFDIQDSLVPPIVSTVAQWHGVLTHHIWMLVRDREPHTLTPYEALLRSSGFGEILTPEEYKAAVTVLNLAAERDPKHSGCLAALAQIHAYGYLFGFDDLSREAGLSYAHRAVAADPADPQALYALALAHSCRREAQAFRNAAERALALNPLDGFLTAQIGMWMAYQGDWDHGCKLLRRAMQLNPRHPGWYWLPLAHDAYRRGAYAEALEHALRVNTPGLHFTHELLARVHVRLGNRRAASQAMKDLAALKPDFPANARQYLERFFAEGDLVDRMVNDLRDAGEGPA